jgi:sugar lactone lactonase YvrE
VSPTKPRLKSSKSRSGDLMPARYQGFIDSSGPQVVPSGTLLANYTVGLFPNNCVFDGTYIWNTNNYDNNNNNNTVTKATTNGETIGTFAVGFNPCDICIDNAGHIWVACGADGAGNIVKFAQSGSVLGDFSYTGNPAGICFDGTNIWITLFVPGTLVRMNLSGVQQGSPITVGDGPVNLHFDGTNIWCANNGEHVNTPATTLTKLSPSGTVLGTFTVGGSPYGICNDASGNIWCTTGAPLGFVQPNPGAVVKLSPSGSVLGTFSMAGNPYWIDFDGTYLWVTQFTSQTVSVMNTSGVVLATYPVGFMPLGLCFDAQSNCYVCNQLTGTISKLAAYTTATNTSYVVPNLQGQLTQNISPPTITKAAVHGTSLALTTTGTWWKGSGGFTYQWELSSPFQGGQTLPGGQYGFQSIVGQTGSSYTPVVGDVGSYVRCRVTLNNVMALSNQSLVS